MVYDPALLLSAELLAPTKLGNRLVELGVPHVLSAQVSRISLDVLRTLSALADSNVLWIPLVGLVHDELGRPFAIFVFGSPSALLLLLVVIH